MAERTFCGDRDTSACVGGDIQAPHHTLIKSHQGFCPCEALKHKQDDGRMVDQDEARGGRPGCSQRSFASLDDSGEVAGAKGKTAEVTDADTMPSGFSFL